MLYVVSRTFKLMEVINLLIYPMWGNVIKRTIQKMISKEDDLLVELNTILNLLEDGRRPPGKMTSRKVTVMNPEVLTGL